MRKLFLLFLLLVTVTVSAETLPRILTVSSDDLQDVGLEEPIVITFNLPMNQTQVETGIRLEPETPHAFYWIDEQTLAIMPQAEWLQATFYTVTIAADVAAVSNETLNEPYVVQFHTTGILNILSVTPESENPRVITDEAQIAVAFDRPVVALVSPSAQDELFVPFTISPSIAGEGLWITTSLYVFTPEEPLQGNTNYTVTIPGGIEALDGSVLNEAYVWSFRTINPQTVGINADKSRSRYEILPDSRFIITFSQPMDRDSTEAAFILREYEDPYQYNYNAATGTPVAGDFEWNEDNTVMTFTPVNYLPIMHSFFAHISTVALAEGGFASLEAPITERFRTVDAPEVWRISPTSYEGLAIGEATIDIHFNTPINNETLESRYTIEPEPVGGIITPVVVAPTHFSLRFQAEADVTYTLTLMAGIEDVYGNAMVEDYTELFATYDPLTADWHLRFDGVNNGLVIAGTYLETPQVGIDAVGDFIATFRIYEVPQTNIPAVPFYWHQWQDTLYQRYDMQTSRYVFTPPAYSVPENVIHEWTVDFGENPVDHLELTLPDGEPLPMGVYGIEVDAPQIDMIDGFLLSVANVGITVKQGLGDSLVWVTDYITGQPVPDVTITRYYQNTVTPLGITDSQGILIVPNRYSLDYVVAEREGIYGVWYGGTSGDSLSSTSSYIYTDRPVYRPGETVYFRGIMRDRDDTDYTVPQALEAVSIQVGEGLQYYSYYNRDIPPEDPIITFEVPVTEFGTFSGEFVIPHDTPLERMRLYAHNCPLEAESCYANHRAYINFEVSHFRVPEFVVRVNAAEDEIVMGEPLNILVSANYYFGGGVNNATVNWTSYNRSGTGHTNSYGEYLITDTTQSGYYSGSNRVEATVIDESGIAITNYAYIHIHPANVYLNMEINNRFSSVDTPFNLDLTTVFPDNTPHPDREITLYVTEIQWVNTSDSFGIYQWEQQETDIGTFTITTDNEGKGEFEFEAPQAGTYRIIAETYDDEGRIAYTQVTLYALDETQAAGQTRFNAVIERRNCGFTPEVRQLYITPDKRSYVPGETAIIFIPNPFGVAATALITVERANVMQEEVIVIEGDMLGYELPITTDLAPNAFVNVTLMAGVDDENPNPRTLRGDTQITVEPIHRLLNVELSASAYTVAPGDEVQFSVRVTDYQGNPVQAEVGLSLTDEAVLVLRPSNADSMISIFNRWQYLSVNTYISARALLTEPDNTGHADCGGAGDDSLILPVAVRENFIYTPLWQPHIITDENGEATVTGTIPDNLTRWRLDARAVTADTSVGQAQMNIVSTLPLIVRPTAPRFFIIGDRAEIGAVVNNQTTTEQTVNVTLQITGAAVADELTRTVTIAGGERARVVWLADINSLEGVDFTVYADSGLYQDAAKPTLTNADGVIPVYRFVAQDTAATSGILDSEMSQQEAISLPGRYSHVEGDLTIQLDASLAEITLDSLAWLDTEHQQNFEHAISRFLPRVVTSHALSEFGIQDAELQNDLTAALTESMNLLHRYQNGDGGFGWLRNTQSNPYITAYVVLGLVEAQAAGYAIDTVVLLRAVQYLELQVNHNVTFNTPDWQLNQQAFLLYVLARSHEDPAMLLADMDRLYRERVQMSLAGRAYLLMAYQIISLDDAEITALADDLLGTAILSATGTHWENTQPDYRSWDSDTRTTALVLNALIQVHPEHPILPGAVRWLVLARRGDHWESTQETVWATMALNEWMVATGDLNANYSYDVSFNDAVLLQGAMQSAQDSEAIVIDVDNMQAGAINNLLINRSDGTGTLYYSAALNLRLPADEVPAISRGIVVERGIFGLENEDYVLVDSAAVGDIVTVRITFTLNQDIYFFALQDVLPAGLEVINPRLLTAPRAGTQPIIERNRADGFWSWATWYFDHIELRDTGAEISADYLPRGTYVFSYQARAVTPGAFQASPAQAYAMYQPEVYGRTNGSLFTVSSAD